MINSFHMNPWLYLLAIPISAIIPFIFEKLENKKHIIFIFILLLLLLLVYLYINNIIGLFDLIALVLIFGFNLFLLFTSKVADLFIINILLFSILPIVATITSFIYNLN